MAHAWSEGGRVRVEAGAAARGRRSFGIVLALVAAGCGAEEPRPARQLMDPVSAPRVCLPGLVQSCDCGGGVTGISTCNPDGLALGACQCPGSVQMPPPTQAPPLGQTPGAPGPTAGGMAPVLPPDDPGAPTADPPDPPASVATLARDIRIAELALFQAVKVSLAQQGEAVIARNAPVVVGKEALLRVYVEPLPGFAPRELEAVLTLSSAEAPVESLTQMIRVDGASREEELDSTINFDIPAGTITADLLYSVELRELDAAAAGATGTIDPAARYPQDEGALAELGARDAGPLRVMLVPYRYNGDGSGRLPVVDEEQLQLFRDYIYAYYPIIDVEFELHDPVDYNSQVGPQTGWEQWLDTHCSLRTSEQPDPKVLYYGVMAPRSDIRSYGGGVVGISYLPGPAANFGRCSVGVGFEGAIAASTMAHELGHSLGLPHAPCGVSGGPYPYEEASIGVWGFGLSSRTLKDPAEHYDLMSYCNPVFISDYNFQKLFERIRYLNLQFDVLDVEHVAQRYVRVLQTPDGTRRVTGHVSTRWTPGGAEEERTLQLFDAAGGSMGSTTGYFFPSSEEGGGLWLVPDHGASAVGLDDAPATPLPWLGLP